ncbi:MAG TPA: VOC family protein [Burkholderiaceae bacterium]|jgi:catechol 2,3-dioxygenase-like lactoylglutathione lyase family enzyme|nr:VOC family protein [Burkholderiaceae bacterium]
MNPQIRGLHHNAYRCSDSERTRRFYEDFLGLPLAGALEIGETKTGRRTAALHTFFQLGDGSYLAFFEVPDMAFEFKPQHDFDLHIALEVAPEMLVPMREKARREGIEVRGISDHGFIDSIYLRDPDGYVVELCARRPGSGDAMDPAQARHALQRWQSGKQVPQQQQQRAARVERPARRARQAWPECWAW